MPDYPHFDDEESLDGWQPDPESDEVPASVTFMEMMRHAAAKAEPPSARDRCIYPTRLRR